jgi:hypothetical protein
MESDRWPVNWCGQIVGWIESPQMDMPHYYGRWVSADSPESIAFLAALREAVDGGGGVEVTVADNLHGNVYVHPEDDDGEIDVRCDWSGDRPN